MRDGWGWIRTEAVLKQAMIRSTSLTWKGWIRTEAVLKLLMKTDKGNHYVLNKNRSCIETASFWISEKHLRSWIRTEAVLKQVKSCSKAFNAPGWIRTEAVLKH